MDFEKKEHYIPSYILAKQLGLNNLVLSKITSNLQVTCMNGRNEEIVNLGLNLKFENKQLKVLGYTRKGSEGRGWDFSVKAKDLISRYMVILLLLFYCLFSSLLAKIPRIF